LQLFDIEALYKGSTIAIGTGLGTVQIWDAEKIQLIRSMTGHTARVGALAWNHHLLSSGSRDRAIFHRDVRVPAQHIRKLSGHKQEVCGLKWNVDENQLASGGNDNKLFVWSDTNETPLHRFNDHTAAVKAIAWNPHQHGILASGGGTADKRIRFWNTLTGTLLSEVDTGSQVCITMICSLCHELTFFVSPGVQPGEPYFQLFFLHIIA
jgi:cell division cycle 20-like protein 1 (cofactor of APC complex)